MRQLTFTFFILISCLTHAQNTSYGINLQGELQFVPTIQNNLEIEVLLVSITGDTLYFEKHSNVVLYDEKTFNIIIGNGDYISGQNSNIENINWFAANKIFIYQKENSVSYELGEYELSVLPYTYHSVKNLTPPNSNNLSDTPNSTFQNVNTLFIYDGTNFIESDQLVNDTVLFTWHNDMGAYSDTAGIAINDLFSDSSVTSLHSDTTIFGILCSYTSYSDTTAHTDTTRISFESVGNWKFVGNNNTISTHFIGTRSNNDLLLTTNNSSRYRLTKEGGFTNTPENIGFRINSKGVLFDLSGTGAIPNITNNHFFMNQAQSAIHIGSPLSDMDTLFGNYSFAFGDNTGTNGSYSTVFGKNTYGDSSLINSITYDAISSFALGNNCKTSYVGVAIGYNCRATYYRNIAIGKDVISGQTSTFLPSAALGIGTNIESSGATAWAMGNNISANGHYSTAIGTNASTNFQRASFVYGDFSTTDTVKSFLSDEFVIRADSGFVFYTISDLSMGVTLDHGSGSWNMISNKNLKENITLLNGSDNFQSILTTPVYKWQYINQRTYHIGPMAQTFNTNFKTGEINNYINSGDLDGVIFGGIKQLKSDIELKDNQELINSTQNKIEQEKTNLDELQRKIDLLYEKISD